MLSGRSSRPALARLPLPVWAQDGQWNSRLALLPAVCQPHLRACWSFPCGHTALYARDNLEQRPQLGSGHAQMG